MSKADIGLIGLVVMGENLILNMESKGFTVACFSCTVSKVDNFINGRAEGKNIISCHPIQELCANLKTPRKVMPMVKASKAVGDFIELLLPHLGNGDIIIDGGNSHFPDTTRRTKYVESKGKLYIGTGVSGGEEDAPFPLVILQDIIPKTPDLLELDEQLENAWQGGGCEDGY